MLRLCVAAVAVVWLALGTAMAEPKPVSLWHVFNLETDMIYGGIKSFNESQSEYRIDPRLVPANQLVAELIKAIATGSVPDLVTLDNPVVASFSAQGSLLDLTDRVSKSKLIKPDVYFKGPWASGMWKGRILRRAARREHAGALLQRRHVPRQGTGSRQPAEDLVRAGGRRGEAEGPGEERVRLRLQRDAGGGGRVPVAAVPVSGRRLDRSSRLAGGGRVATASGGFREERRRLARRAQPAPVRGDQHIHGGQHGDGDVRAVGTAAAAQRGEVRLAAEPAAGEGRQEHSRLVIGRL